MPLNNDHIGQLIMEKAMQMISPEDDLFLQQLMEKNEAVRQQYEQACDKMQQATNKGIQPPTPETGWQQLDAKLIRRKRLKNRSYAIGAAAAILLVLLAGTLYFSSTQTGKQNTAITANKKEQLRLKLADGRIITLTDRPEISVNGMILTNDSSNHILRYRSSGKSTPENNKLNTLSVPAGQNYKIELADGTMVTLNALTQLSFPSVFSGNTREISINGEAYLKVAHNADKPFIVHLPVGKVQVLGTQFNINTYNSAAQKVSLVEGSLKCSASNHSLILVPGKAALLSENAITEQILNEDELTWIKGEYMMNNSQISEIALLITRWYGVQVILDGPTTGNKRFSGIIYKNNPLEDFLTMLKSTTDADYYFQGSVLHIK
uniref:FecR family protein n=1 Tax=Pedobacter schmidteae TaxID=2201271 RepID=UPI000EB407AA|nr:FecR domain-containing protein [Pedobacter schmidteae]